MVDIINTRGQCHKHAYVQLMLVNALAINFYFIKRKLWSSSRALGSQSEGRGFYPRPMLDGSGVKAMPGLIPTPNSGSL